MYLEVCTLCFDKLELVPSSRTVSISQSLLCNIEAHLIDLLEGKALGLGHEHIRKYRTECAGRAPYKEDLDAEVALIAIHNEWCYDANDAVPEPVARSRQGNAFRTNRKLENLANNDP